MSFLYSNFFLALLSGLLLIFGWPTYGEPLLLFVAFIPLLVVEHRIRHSGSRRRGLNFFLISYSTLFLWNVGVTWWLWNSSPSGGGFTFIANTLLMTVVFYLYHIVSKRLNDKQSLIFLIALFLSFEKFHLNWEFSWPWLNLGNAFSERVSWVQWYEYTGVFGGTLWIWIVNVYIFRAFMAFKNQRNRRVFTQKIAKAILIIVLPISISLVMFSRYQEKENLAKILVLQPNFDPYTEKYTMSNREIYDSLFKSFDIDTLSVDLILAPETVFYNPLEYKNLEHSYLAYNLREKLSTHPYLSFLSGVFLFQKEKVSNRYSVKTKQEYINFYNAAFILNKDQKINIYNKSKPVAGVEIFPYKHILQPILGNLLIDLGGVLNEITPQQEREVFYNADKTLSIAPIICYESIFGEFVTDYVRKGSQMLAVMTNDGWWGDTQGYKQLLSYTKLRAIENRRSIVRSANTGISAFINQRGEVTKALEYGTKGTLEGYINLNNNKTFYTLYGDIIARLGIFLSGIIFLVAMSRKKKKNIVE